MAIVSDPGQDILGGDDVPDAPIDPNAPQIRVITSKKMFNVLINIISQSNSIPNSCIILRYLTMGSFAPLLLGSIHLEVEIAFRSEFQVRI